MTRVKREVLEACPYQLGKLHTMLELLRIAISDAYVNKCSYHELNPTFCFLIELVLITSFALNVILKNRVKFIKIIERHIKSLFE